MQPFKALLIEERDGVVCSGFVRMDENQLDAGNVTIRVAYSSVNYKDALAATGAGKIIRRFPCVGGIDLCGTVVESADPRFALGDSVIATSFADIFYNNCFKNGILPIVLPQEAVDVLMADARKGANARITVDLESQTVTTSDGQSFAFDVDAHRKHCLMNGLDDIGLTMEKSAAIDSFESKAKTLRPWV